MQKTNEREREREREREGEREREKRELHLSAIRTEIVFINEIENA